MTNDKMREKRKIWIYAVILFASAFILLFFTAYSQIKLNKSIKDYGDQLKGNDKEQSRSGLDLNTSLQLNSQLSNQLKGANSKIAELTGYLNEQKKLNSDTRKAYDELVKTFDYLIKAENMYKKRELTSCAVTLEEGCKKELLSKNALDRYNFLKNNSFDPAAINLYFKGYKEYKMKRYKSAINNFQLSLKLAKDEYVSDDCYYFIAFCEYKTGNTELAKSNINTLISNYPNSSYISGARQLLNDLT